MKRVVGLASALACVSLTIAVPAHADGLGVLAAILGAVPTGYAVPAAPPCDPSVTPTCPDLPYDPNVGKPCYSPQHLVTPACVECQRASVAAGDKAQVTLDKCGPPAG